MSQFALGTIPFDTIYLHGMVRDAQGRKFSKSLGNGVDPVDVIGKFGADAARMALVVGNTAGTDMRISEDKIKGYKHFANKLWNITRFILEKSPEVTGTVTEETDTALLTELEALVQEVTDDIESHRVYLAAEKLYHYAWHRLADTILEESKPILAGDDTSAKHSRSIALRNILDTLLRLLHPFMPFVTEEIWQGMKGKENLLMVTPWPSKKITSA